MIFDRKQYSNEQLLLIYKALLKPRLIEEKMLILLRQGKVSKWFSGIGQEAIAVGSTLALDQNDYILPLHRNLGVFTARNMDLGQLFAQFQGKKRGFSNGRERSFHFGSNKHHIVGMISHLGPQLGVADGIALGNLLKKNKHIALAYSGDGGASQGDFHEALNVAAVWNLPLIFVVENNGYGLSTPSNEQFRCKQFIDKGIGYGMEAIQIDGNNILEVYTTVLRLAAELKQNPRPILLECMTFRMRGHEEASGTKYVPQELFDTWIEKDPIINYQNYLLTQGIINSFAIENIKLEIRNEIDQGISFAFDQPEIVANTQQELADVYMPHQALEHKPQTNHNSTERRFCDAITDGLDLAMSRHQSLVLMGQDIADYGGVFKITQGLMAKYGRERVRNTPLCESAIIGCALGLSIMGFKSMVEMQFADFVTCGFNQIVNNLAKIHYRWGQNADVVVRMPTGAGVGAGPFHSQSNEAWFFHVAGLKIVYPSNPTDAKGLLLASFEDPNPVLFFEHKVLYRSISEPTPDDYYTTPIGQAKIVQTGSDLTIITYGMGVHWAKEALKNHSHIAAELIDLRTLMPWDKETVFASVKKTGKALVLHEDNLTGGIGAELSASITEHCFKYLDAPVMRCGALDTPVPFSMGLEENYLQKETFVKTLQTLHNY